jgi:hypothetical protein
VDSFIIRSAHKTLYQVKGDVTVHAMKYRGTRAIASLIL